MNWNAGSLLIDCLKQMLDALRYEEHELIVVDNCSSDGSIAALAESCPNVRVVRNASNLGYPKGNNIGAWYLIAHGCDFVAFVNPDVRVEDQTLQRLRQALAADLSAGCAGGEARASSLSGVVEEVPRVYRKRPTVWQKLVLYGFFRLLPVVDQVLSPLIARLRKQHYIGPDTIKDGESVYAVCGACFMVRASAFGTIGGFDESTFLFEEEFILSEKLGREGYTVIGVPSAKFLHVGGHAVSRRPVHSALCFIRSERHLVKSYYNWSWFRRALLAAWRWPEFGFYAGLCALKHVLEMLRDLGGRGASEGGGRKRD